MKQEQQAIDAQYEKKTKGAVVQQKMCVLPYDPYPYAPDLGHADPQRSTQSTFTNKSRLKLLHRREEHVQDLFDSARQSLAELSQVRLTLLS